MKSLTKRISCLGAAWLLALALAACGGQDGGSVRRVDSGDNAVIDEAGVLSTDTENYVTNLSVALQESCGAQIGVYTVEYIGNTTMEGYAYEVFNAWGLGDDDKDNGILLLLAVGEDDYWVMRGSGLESQLSVSTLSGLLDRQLEPSWVQGDYDTGTRNTVRTLAERLCSIYGLTMDVDAVAMGGGSAAAGQAADGGVPWMTVLLVIIAVLLIIWVIGMGSRSRRRGPPPPPAGYGGYGGYGGSRSSFGSGFASGVGFGMGQSVGRRLGGGYRRRTPPPPPPPPPRTGPGPGMGGFGGSRGGMGGAGRSTPRSGGFGMGGAGRSSGGIGRSGGSFRAGGGSARGGGAGRRH